MQEQNIFARRKFITEKLISYGFVKKGSIYEYSVPILEGEFRMYVLVSEDEQIVTRVVDISSGEEFILHRVQVASGSFVGKVKKEYEDILLSIRDNCTEKDVFKSEISKQVILYVREKYGDELEFLWEKVSDNAVWRRKDSKKWYAAMLMVSKRKLGLDSDEMVEIIDLHIKPDEITPLIDGVRYFPGYHMNKKSWYTICLDGSVTVNEICERIDKSYELAH